MTGFRHHQIVCSRDGMDVMNSPFLYSKDFKMGKLYIKPTTGYSYVRVLCDSLGVCVYNWPRDGPIGLKILFQTIHPSGLPSVKNM